MTKIGFIGLGIMGSPMAVNLQNAGYVVTGFNRSPGKADALVAAGGTEGEDIEATVAEADIIALMLPDSPDVEEVLTRDGGVFERAKRGSIIIDFSTIRPNVATDMAHLASQEGFTLLDAPVSGGEAGAIAAQLSIMVGGDLNGFEQVKNVLKAVGKTVIHVGPSGSGQTVKAANQLIVAGNIGLLAEALLFLEAHGVKSGPAVEVLGGGLAGSAVLNQKATNMLERKFEPGFRIDLHYKDMGIALAAARSAGVSIPLGTVASGLVEAARLNGDGNLDHSAIFRVIERLSGKENQ